MAAVGGRLDKCLHHSLFSRRPDCARKQVCAHHLLPLIAINTDVVNSPHFVLCRSPSPLGSRHPNTFMASFLQFLLLATSEKADTIQWISSVRDLRNCFLRQAGGWCHHHVESSCAPKALRRQLQYVILKQGPLSLTARQDTFFARTSLTSALQNSSPKLIQVIYIYNVLPLSSQNHIQAPHRILKELSALHFPSNCY